MMLGLEVLGLVLVGLVLYGVGGGLVYVVCWHWDWIEVDCADAETWAAIWPLFPVRVGYRLVTWIAGLVAEFQETGRLLNDRRDQ